MLTEKTQYSLSRRGSKLLVEAVIGIIGLLGIMLAQVSDTQLGRGYQQLKGHGEVLQSQLARKSPQVDWMEILF